MRIEVLQCMNTDKVLAKYHLTEAMLIFLRQAIFLKVSNNSTLHLHLY